MKKITFEEAQEKWPLIEGCNPDMWDTMLRDMMNGYNQAIDDRIAEAGKMIDNKVMLQRAYGWLRSHYPNVEVLHIQVEVMASYMARFAQEQIKSLKEEPMKPGEEWTDMDDGKEYTPQEPTKGCTGCVAVGNNELCEKLPCMAYGEHRLIFKEKEDKQ